MGEYLPECCMVIQGRAALSETLESPGCQWSSVRVRTARRLRTRQASPRGMHCTNFRLGPTSLVYMEQVALCLAGLRYPGCALEPWGSTAAYPVIECALFVIGCQ